MTIRSREEIKDLLPYKPGKPIANVKKEYGLTDVIKLASNENPLGSSPKAKAAISNALEDLHLYPDGNATALKERLAYFLGLHPNMVLPSGGSDEMVDIIAKAYLNHHDEVIMADITFPRYISVTKMMGATPVIVPLKNHTYDLDAMAEKLSPKTSLVWLCNPNNPTGTMFTEGKLLEFLDKVPANVMVVYDEAYNEYVTRDDYPKDSMSLLKKYSNVVILRTFSKVYGLAALRVGFAVAAEDIISNLNRVRGPFNVSTLAQIAAIAALDDKEFVSKSYEVNKLGKEYLYKELEALNLEYAPSETNHIYFNAGIDGGTVFVELQKKGMIIRPINGTWVRVTIGTMEENKIFIELLRDLLK